MGISRNRILSYLSDPVSNELKNDMDVWKNGIFSYSDGKWSIKIQIVFIRRRYLFWKFSKKAWSQFFLWRMQADDELIYYKTILFITLFPLFWSSTVFLGNLGLKSQNLIQFYICLGAAVATNKLEASAQCCIEKWTSTKWAKNAQLSIFISIPSPLILTRNWLEFTEGHFRRRLNLRPRQFREF